MADKIFPLSTIRHSSAHMLAQAVQRFIDPYAQLGTWPAIDNGFYYDIAFSEGTEFGENDCKSLTKNLQRICNEKQTFVIHACPLNEGYEINALTNQTFKDELLDKFKEQWTTDISYYLNVAPRAVLDNLRDAKDWYKTMYETVSDYFRKLWTIGTDDAVLFIDLCAGPHVDMTKTDIDTSWLKIDKIAWAYRQADENNAMMTRVYGLAFEDKDALKTYETMLEEAKKRDHRVLGKQLKLFTISPLVGAGLPLMQPNGMIVRKEIQDYLRKLHEWAWYSQVRTPHLAKEELYVCSGHADKFGDELFKVQGKEDQFFMKPMNCPHHMQIFADNSFSYRDMPVRYFEHATVYRDEKTGQLGWLTRVRAITQDDWHLFCRINQIKQEVSTIVDIIKKFYTTLWMVDDYRVSLSVRWDDGKLYLGWDDVWIQAEGALEEAAVANNLPYKKIEGEAAFYWPKLDFMFKDAIWREWQLATIQCDFNLPERFDLSFTNEAGDKERPVVIHRAISWSAERCMGVLIEHFAWAFPVRLAPTQAVVVPVADTFNEYAQTVLQTLQDKWLRITIDDNSDSLNKKIRNSEKMKIPYTLVVGEKEMTNNSVNVRSYRTKEQHEIWLDTFAQQLHTEYTTRSL